MRPTMLLIQGELSSAIECMLLQRNGEEHPIERKSLETMDSEHTRRLFLGWPLGWAFTAAALGATNGTSLGIALGAAGMFAGAWWSRGRREAAAYAAAFVLAAGILKLGL